MLTLCKCSLFAGSFAQDDFVNIFHETTLLDHLNGLEELEALHLIGADLQNSHPWYSLLPSIQDYARTHLQQLSDLEQDAYKNLFSKFYSGYYDEVDMTSLMEIRKMISAVGEKEGIKITYLPIMIKAASAALNEYPTLNSYVSKDESTQTIKSAHNIGLAMDTPRGLLVPNVKNCEQRSILDIAYEINRLQALGTANKLGEEELTGGTFTLSNIGSIGGTYA